MSSPKHIVKKILNKAIQRAFPDMQTQHDCLLTVATQAKFGHFQCNSAMPLAKILKLSPRDIAEQIRNQVLQNHADHFENIDIAGPGFINLRLANDFVGQCVTQQSQHAKLGCQTTTPQRVIIDFSSPNIAKEMHVGHLRSTIIGDCLANVFEYIGEDVCRLNHIGDWGTAFGMLIAYIRETQAEHALDNASLTDLMQWYRQSKKHFDADTDFADRARAAVVALQGGDTDARNCWKTICAISEKAYQAIYTLLNVRITTRGESFYNAWLADTVKRLQAADLITESDGAQCVFLPGFTGKDKQPLPMIVQKSDGGYNYTTTDLAALTHRIETEKADRIIYVTDQGQQLHFKMLFAGAKAAGILPDAVQVDHVPFGLVLGKDGKKLKTRSGDVDKLIDLLNDGIAAAHTILKERHPEWSEQRCQQDATMLGIAAIKYADLSCHRQSDYQFNIDNMLAFEGNTAAFIQYAVVRINSILTKATAKPTKSITVTHNSEVELAMQCLAFTDMIETVTLDLTPNRITDYLYELACRFNAFYRDCRIDGSTEAANRLALSQHCHQILTTGLTLLGINTLKQM